MQARSSRSPGEGIPGDRFEASSSYPGLAAGKTDALRVHRIGDIERDLISGAVGSVRSYRGGDARAICIRECALSLVRMWET
jgi:hypothetical protein